MNTQERAARIRLYEMFRTPTIDEFRNGFEYEYVQLSFSDILIHLPDLDDNGKKPRCTYHTNWAKAVWGAPWSVMRLSNLKELMKKDKVRAKKKLPTKYLKDLLQRQALSFNWKGLQIVVFPKKTIQRNGVEIIDQHNVYVNGVEQTIINNKPKSKLHIRLLKHKFSESLDWSYLLDLDKGLQTNVLYQYFEGVFTKNEDVFLKIGVNFITGGPENICYQPIIVDYAKKKRRIKETKYANVVNSITVYNHKSEDELSGYVLEERELAVVKRIEQTVREEMLAAIKAQKQAERILADDRNRQNRVTSCSLYSKH